jgi:hypothetical protein
MVNPSEYDGEMSNAEYSGKIAAKTFKQIAQERLLKATVIPASELPKQKSRIRAD